MSKMRKIVLVLRIFFSTNDRFGCGLAATEKKPIDSTNAPAQPREAKRSNSAASRAEKP